MTKKKYLSSTNKIGVVINIYVISVNKYATQNKNIKAILI